jgi:hypothetical protein
MDSTRGAEKMFEAVVFHKLPEPEIVPDGLPYPTHRGVMTFMGCELEVLVLNTGQRIIPEDSIAKFLRLSDG